jgi:hypothetical protein
MPAKATYSFRLTIASKAEGVFRFDTSQTRVPLPEGPQLSLVARNADSLCRATKFHFEASGFPDEKCAREAGERLRLRLRIVNAFIGLGLNVPREDSVSSQLSASVKEDLQTKHGAIVMDSIWGLSVFPDDDRHFEYALVGKIDNFRDSSYIFAAIGKLWPVDVQLDPRCEDALQLLNLATTETSERAAFLTAYLAMEALIPRQKRSKVTTDFIKTLERRIQKAGERKRMTLETQERKSLLGAVTAMREESFTSAFTRFAKSVQSPTQLKGMPLREFVSRCISTRHRIAHSMTLDPSINLHELTTGLRELAMLFIWTHNRIPSVSFETPASSLAVPSGGIQMRVF